jgi:tetratricopeptide (TPR) repeat protein
MKKLLKPCLVALLILMATLSLRADETEIISYLRDKKWTARRDAANILATMNSKTAVKSLIDALESEDKEEVKSAVHNALVTITGQKQLLPDYNAWIKWWDETGSKEFNETSLTERELAETRTYLNVSFIVIIISLLILFLFIMVFSFIGGSKIKETKEIIKKVERYVSEADGVTQRFDNLMNEIEKKHTESAEFFHKLKEENSVEIERFSDLLQQNLEHRIREGSMSLREKAENELKATVAQTKQDMERDIKKLLAEQRETLDKELEANKKKFSNEAEAYTTFIGGSFYLLNGRNKDALKYFKKVLDLNPGYYHAWNNHGTALRNLERYDEAVESYKKSLQLAPDNPIILYNLATAYALLHKKADMLEYLKKAFVIDSELKDEALNDTIFKPYWNDRDFKNLAEV